MSETGWNSPRTSSTTLSYSEGWRAHLQELRSLFVRVRAAGLTVKPSNCHFGFLEVEFLGHVVGRGNLKTMADKTQKTANAPIPRTKKQMRSFLGLARYYRRFCQTTLQSPHL